MQLAAFESAVAGATDPLNALSELVLGDFTVDAGGVHWWAGHLDGRRLTVLSNVLVDAINGTVEAVLDASLAAAEHREMLYADNTWLRQTATRLHKTGVRSEEEYLKAWMRGPKERRRERRLEAAAHDAMGHMVQALDRVAAAIAIVAASPVEIRRIDWGRLNADLVRPAKKQTDSKKLEPLGTTGRQLQDDMLLRVLDHPKFGPRDWLDWLRDTRNAATHRGDRVKYMLVAGEVSGRKPLHLVRAMPAQPQLTDVEALARAPEGRGDIAELLVIKHSDAMVDGLLQSTTNLVTHLAEGLTDTYLQRRDDPKLLIQRGAQWEDLGGSTPRREFPGYGPYPDVRLQGSMRVNPINALRIECAHIVDGEREAWWGDYAGGGK